MCRINMVKTSSQSVREITYWYLDGRDSKNFVSIAKKMLENLNNVVLGQCYLGLMIVKRRAYLIKSIQVYRSTASGDANKFS